MALKRLYLLLLSISLLGGMVNAGEDKDEPVKIHGTVCDATGEPLAGVAIRIQGVGGVFYTDLDGQFEIPFPKNGKRRISLSSVSYKDKHVVLDANQAGLSEGLRIQLETGS